MDALTSEACAGYKGILRSATCKVCAPDILRGRHDKALQHNDNRRRGGRPPGHNYRQEAGLLHMRPISGLMPPTGQGAGQN